MRRTKDPRTATTGPMRGCCRVRRRSGSGSIRLRCTATRARNQRIAQRLSRATYVTSNSLSMPVRIARRKGTRSSGCEKICLRCSPRSDYKQRLRLRLCFVCLRGGHITRNCASRTKCKVEDCGRMHATSIACRQLDDAAGTRA